MKYLQLLSIGLLIPFFTNAQSFEGVITYKVEFEFDSKLRQMEDQLIEKQRLKDLRQMIKELKPQYKNILILRYFESKFLMATL